MYQIPSSILIRSLILPGVPLSLLRSFPILTVVRSRFSSMVIILIHSLVHGRHSQVYVISLLIFSTRISNMLNPLIVINLIGEG